MSRLHTKDLTPITFVWNSNTCTCMSVKSKDLAPCKRSFLFFFGKVMFCAIRPVRLEESSFTLYDRGFLEVVRVFYHLMLPAFMRFAIFHGIAIAIHSSILHRFLLCVQLLRSCMSCFGWSSVHLTLPFPPTCPPPYDPLLL